MILDFWIFALIEILTAAGFFCCGILFERTWQASARRKLYAAQQTLSMQQQQQTQGAGYSQGNWLGKKAAK